MFKLHFLLKAALVCSILTGCVSPKVAKPPQADPNVAQSQANADILREAASVGYRNQDAEYKLGTGDVLDVKVFRAEEMDRMVRVSGLGEVALPLVGVLRVSGLSVSQTESLIASRLQQSFMQNPQVTVYVSEYGSNQVTVMGEVATPNVYSVTQPRTVLELLSMAGGVTERAGDQVRVQTTHVNPSTGEPDPIVFVLSLRGLLAGGDSLYEMTLNAGDSIYVPKAGVVFVEGAVNKPGAYPIQGGATALKAVTMAEGAEWSAESREIQVLREGASEPFVINIEAAKKDPRFDMYLQDGDVVVVNHNMIKRPFELFFDGLSRVVNVGVGYRF